eukprot:9493387-Pyramimonas_sp.AAC.4
MSFPTLFGLRAPRAGPQLIRRSKRRNLFSAARAAQLTPSSIAAKSTPCGPAFSPPRALRPAPFSFLEASLASRWTRSLLPLSTRRRRHRCSAQCRECLVEAVLLHNSATDLRASDKAPSRPVLGWPPARNRGPA